MLKPNPVLLSVTVLVIASLACFLPTASAPVADQNLVGTMVAQTVIAAQIQTEQGFIPNTGISPTPTFTFTAEPPTVTPTVTLTPTPMFTATPLVPLISVSTPTNCRVGPGKIYDRTGALLVGETAEVVGRDPTGNYWYIRNPDVANDYCWLWGEYATVTGNYAALPMMTPPPTPTAAPSFDLSYEGRDTCSGWWVDLILENTGTMTFDSVSITVKDTVTGVSHTISSDEFTDFDSCSDYISKDTLPSGEMRVMSSAKFDYDVHGDKMNATVTVCSNEGMNGMCVTEKLTFTP
ncbi:MAG: SH3 domain-containing protein [Anaerolineales bacterium]